LISLKICFVSPEVFGWGTHGGIGYVTRLLSKKLVETGLEVSIVTPRRKEQKEVEDLEGVTVYGYDPYINQPQFMKALTSRINSIKYYQRVKADIYHSQEASYNTLAALKAVPNSKHVITFQDPYTIEEWKKIEKVDEKYTFTKMFQMRLFIERQLISITCKKADALYTQADFLIPRINHYYKINSKISLIRNPIIPVKRDMIKADSPTFCFLGRWDPQKRVEIFLNLARFFPKCKFIAMGHSHNQFFDEKIRKCYKNISNLQLTGFVSEEEKSEILEKSWGLINTSIREALPVSFLEALAHETPIISCEDPEFLTSVFGYKVYSDSFVKTISEFLRNDEWINKGKKGRQHVEKFYDVNKVTKLQVKAYESVIESEAT